MEASPGQTKDGASPTPRSRGSLGVAAEPEERTDRFPDMGSHCPAEHAHHEQVYLPLTDRFESVKKMLGTTVK